MEYKKDFDKWNNVKKELDSNNRAVSFNEKEIWWSNVGVNVGSEQDGKGKQYLRPVYVLKKLNPRMFIGIPLTSILREDINHVTFYFNYDFSTALIFQVKTFDKSISVYW